MGVDYKVSVLYGWKIPAKTTKQILEIIDNNFFDEELEQHLFFANAYTDFKDQDCIIGIELNSTEDFEFLEIDCNNYHRDILCKYYVSLIEMLPKEVLDILKENIDITKTNIYIMHQIW